MKKIYFANIWTELVSIQFLELLEIRGYFASGNWFAGKYHSPLISPETDLVVYAPSYPSGSLVLTPKNLVGIPTIFWAMFPDYLAGWDFQKNIYAMRSQKEVNILLSRFSGQYAASKYVANLMEKTYRIKCEVLYSGIPIKELARYRKTEWSEKPTVLWNHMWRLDKGFPEVLKIISLLAKKYPQNQFVIARKYRWGDDKHSPLWMKENFNKFLSEKPQNVFFQENYNPGADKNIQKSYWQFLASADIGFSCSHHEGFGVSMLEQAALGLACVVPNKEVYPEIYPPDCLSEPSPALIARAIEDLLNNPKKLLACSNAAKMAVNNFSVEKEADNFVKIFRDKI